MPASILNEKRTESVVFQFDPTDDDYIISFQRQLDPSDQDISLGYDKICMTYYEMVQYGCVLGWELASDIEIKLTLTPKAARTFEMGEVVTFGCEDVDDIRPYYEKVREMLVATGELKK